VQVTEWKKKLSTLASSVFEGGKQRAVEDFSAERTDLHSKIGGWKRGQGKRGQCATA